MRIPLYCLALLFFPPETGIGPGLEANPSPVVGDCSIKEMPPHWPYPRSAVLHIGPAGH